MHKTLPADSMSHWANSDLNQELAKLLGQFLIFDDECSSEVIDNVIYSINADGIRKACHQNYLESWNILMPLSVKLGAFLTPLAWEFSPKKYRAKHIALSEDNSMAHYGSKYMSDDNDPARCLVMTLIKIKQLKPELSKQFINS